MLVVNTAFEDELISEVALKPFALHSGAAPLNGIDDVDTHVDEGGQDFPDGAVAVGVDAGACFVGQVDHALSGIEGIGSEYQIVLGRKDDGKDYMTLKVERAQGVDPGQDSELGGKIKGEIKKQIMVSADVELFEYGSLPRSERKSKRVFDNRDNC